jgi:glycosyltransferase involved in cell wall biosynthesis
MPRAWLQPRERGGAGDPSLDLHALAPPMVPWMRPRALRALNRASVRNALVHCAAALGIERPVLVVTVPNAVDAAGALNERLLVYYCVDDFTLWPGVDRRAAEALEAELLERADIVVATSDRLAETRGRAGKPTYVLQHGVDVAHLARASSPETTPLPGIRRGRPVLGYLGLIDARTDAALLAAVARARRDWDVVLVGPVDRVPTALRAEPNVPTISAVPYARVPEALAAFDVAILPYARNDLTAAINPLKLREYLASGRPVVATPLPEVARFAPHVRLAGDAASFVREVEAALAGPRDLRAVREALLRDESWEAWAACFLGWCTGGRDARGGVPTRASAQEAR